jgi:hypothetical protein
MLTWIMQDEEMLNDVKRHGEHNVFWCYGYERQISTYVNIKTNKKDNKISYSKFHAWMASPQYKIGHKLT